MTLPIIFLEKMRTLLGDEYEAFVQSYDKERVQGLRINTLKADAYKFLNESPFHLTKIIWADEGYYYEPDDRPGRHPYHAAGVYYIQEPSAMSVVQYLNPVPGECVLDLCAAPGGKTTHIAERLCGEGLLVSNEIHPSRAKILSQNVERLGVKNAVVTNADSEKLLKYFPEFFDKIVVDAPCSGEGMFRKDENACDEWSPEHVKMCAERQLDILCNAAQMLRPGGRIVYSTCTFSPEENEGTIERFLEKNKEFYIEEVPLYPGFSNGRADWISSKNSSIEKTIRIFPHKTEGEGHFLAVLRKEDGFHNIIKRKQPLYFSDKKILNEFKSFCQETLLEYEIFTNRKEWVLFGDQLYLLPKQMPDFSGLRVLRAGLNMGTVKKNRFEPSHALALSLKETDVRQSCNLKAEDDAVTKYLRGETLTYIGEKGWVLMCVDGYSAGWAKLAGETLKNYYPKGLRIRC